MLEREIDKFWRLWWCKQENQCNKHHDVDYPIADFLRGEVAHVVEEDNLLDKFNYFLIERENKADENHRDTAKNRELK